MAETVHLYLRGPAIPPLSFTYQKIESIVGNSFYRPNPAGDGTTEQFRTQAAGATLVFTVPLTNGALGNLQRLAPLQGADTVCYASLGRENSIECLSFARQAKLLEVAQLGAQATLKLQLL